MAKSKFAILFAILSLALAMPPPNWYPKHEREIVNKCFEEADITAETKLCIFTDSPKLRAYLLCKAKGMNVYSEDLGFNVDRLSYMYFKQPDEYTMFQDCVDKHKDISLHEEKVYKTLRCIADARYDEMEKLKKL